MDIGSIRKTYRLRKFDLENLEKNPFAQFENWFSEAVEAQIEEVNAMALATADLACRPSCRMVLLKHFDEQGMVFFTNYTSRKAKELEQNPYACCTIFWGALERQVCFEGPVDRTTPQESAHYFHRRPRGSQLGALASKQDQVLASRKILEEEYEKLATLYPDEVPLPKHWGGFRLHPVRFEFWQGREDRLHDRFAFRLEKGIWVIERLSP